MLHSQLNHVGMWPASLDIIRANDDIDEWRVAPTKTIQQMIRYWSVVSCIQRDFDILPLQILENLARIWLLSNWFRRIRLV